VLGSRVISGLFLFILSRKVAWPLWLLPLEEGKEEEEVEEGGGEGRRVEEEGEEEEEEERCWGICFNCFW